MISIADLAEELQHENKNVNILDEDTYDGKPALIAENSNHIIGVTLNEDNIMAHFEDYDNGETLKIYLISEDNIPDFYDELASFIYWVKETVASDIVTPELDDILTVLQECGYEPILDWQPGIN